MINITQDLAQQIGELLASYRRRCRLTQSELANRLGLSSKSGTVSISHLENGKFKNLSLDLILNYLTVCEIP
ncbi:MAG: helix-turn-helix domain-containing protein, partial [candidate division WOR-3 bacterium]|nr:helix-turn-helix domain-containing protein [candidate division WOR-3 bacterium]